MKKLILLFILFSNWIAAQQATFNIQSNFGYRDVHLRNVLPTDSCYYVNGSLRDTGQVYKGGSLFLKLSLTGDTLHTQKLVVPFRNYQATNTGLLTAPDGNLVTAGVVLDSLVRVILMKYTPEGDTIFIKEYPNPEGTINSYISAVDLQRHSYGYYLTATFIIAGSKNKTVVWKLDELGNVIQQKTYGYGISMGESVGSTLVNANDGITIGVCRHNLSITQNNLFCQNHIFQVDSLGNVGWQYFSPNTQLLYIPTSMVNASDGGLVVASNKGIEHVLSPSLSALISHNYIYKLDADHQFVWGREFRGSQRGGPHFVDILQANDGGGYVAYGTVRENVSDGVDRDGTWIVKVSNQGDSLWARYYTIFDGFYGRPDPEDFKATPDGGYIVCGRVPGGSENFGWIMKLDSFGCLVPGCNANDGPNSTNEEAPSLHLTIYPNPTTDFLNIFVNAPIPASRASFRIINSEGSLVKAFKTDNFNSTYIIPVRDWAAGGYYLQYMEQGEVRATNKFIVSK
jgi:Secretion system C-terminal sorting domain